MKFALAVFAAPQSPASRRALRFAQALLAQQHQLLRIFFYQDGVHNASRNIVSPQDELDLPAEWQDFVREQQLDAPVCIAAALRRGLLNREEANRYGRSAANLNPEWELGGLGLWHEAMQQADRVVCFGGT